jgi:MFS family permease
MKKQVVAIALITTVSLLGNAMLYIVLPVYWREFGLDALWQIGVLLSFNRFLRLPLGPVTGWLYRRITRRSAVMLAVALAAVTTWSYGYLHGFWALLLMRGLWGAAYSILRLGGQLTVISASTDTTRGEMTGTYNGLWGLGHLVGLLVGGFWADAVGVEGVCLLFAVMAVGATPFVWRYVPAEKEIGFDGGSVEVKAVQAVGKTDPAVLRLLVSAVLVSMIFFGLLTATLSRLFEIRGLDSLELAGWSLGAATLAGVIQSARNLWDPFLAPWFGHLTDGARGRLRLYLPALAVGAIAFAAVGLDLPVAAWIGLLLLLQLLGTIVTTLTDALAADIAAARPQSRVRVLTCYSVCIDLGAAIGPVLAFLCEERIGLPTLYVAAGCVLLVVLVIWSGHRRREQPLVHGK